MSGSRALRFLQLGRESSAGSAVAASTTWRGQGALQDERETQFPAEDVGIFGGADRGYIPKVGATLVMESTPVTYEQLPHILEAGVKTVGTGVADGVGSGNVYSYPLPTTAANTIKTYTVEGGDDQQAEEVEYAFVESFKLSGKAGEAWMMEAAWRGRQATNTTKTGALTIPTVEEALFQRTSLYIDDNGGTLGTTLKSNTLIGAELNITTGWVARWAADGNLYFSQPVLGQPSIELKVTFLHDGTSVAEKTKWRDGASRLIRLLTVGSALGTAGTAYTTKTLRIDLAGKWVSFDKLGEDTGNDIVTATFRGRYNAGAGLNGVITVVNELAAIP